MPTLLTLDTASPLVSVAVGRDGEVLAVAALPQRSSSARLVGLLEEALGEAEVTIGDLDGVVAVRGPGSFTGIRVGLATVLGIHQGRSLPATAVSTLWALALAAPEGAARVLAAVHAAGDEWFVQPFATAANGEPRPGGEPARLPAADAAAVRAELVVRHPAGRDPDPFGARGHDPGPLAAPLARRLSRRLPSWEPSLLTRPLYLAPPPATVPGPPKAVSPAPPE